MRWIGLLIAFVIALIAGRANAEYDFCYEGDPPPHVEIANRPICCLDFALIPIIQRRACGLTTTQDETFIEGLLIQIGCTAESDFGRAFLRALSDEFDADPAIRRFDEERESRPEAARQFCAAVAQIPMPTAGRPEEMTSEEFLHKFGYALDEVERVRSRLQGQR